MSVIVSTCIQAVPERLEQVNAQIHSSLSDGVRVFVDRYRQGPLFGMLETIKLALSRRATHILVLEDDLILCRDFVPGVSAAIEAQPDLPLHYSYLGKSTTPMPDARFVHLAAWWGSQAYSMPVALAEKFVEFCEDPASGQILAAIARAQPDYRPEMAKRWALASDVWLRFGLEVLGQPMWHTAPSLAKHGEPEVSTTIFTIAPDEVTIRQSPWFIGDTSALYVEWDAVPAAT